MNPTLYDVLGVSRDASPEEIRKAWRDAADRFEPGSGGSTRQFRLFNEAAEVLLDPERRRAYDQGLEEQEAEEPAPAAAVVPGPPMPGTSRAATPEPAPAEPASVVQPVERRPWRPRRSRGSDEASTHEEPAAGPRRGLPGWVLAVLGALTALAVGVAVFVTLQAQRAADHQEALDRAPAAAESAAAAVLSYGHESLEADRDTAARYLTERYRSEYLDTFDKLVSENAQKTRANVEAEVLASAAMLGGGDRDPDRVPVLLFVNQTTTSAADEQPSIALNRVRLDMRRVDGTWLVDDITSY